LKARQKKEMLIPSLLEDFGWHAHMLDHDNYVKDTKAWFGDILNHDTTTRITRERRKRSDQLRSEFDFASIGAASIGAASIGAASIGAASIGAASIGANKQRAERNERTESSSDCAVLPPNLKYVCFLANVD
jgi:hypothetical protein